VQNQKQILVYTAQHTGTWFVINLLRTANSNSNRVLADNAVRLRGRILHKNYEKNNPFAYIDDKVLSEAELAESSESKKGYLGTGWLKRTFLNYTTEEENSVGLLILHNHCKQFDSTLIKYLRIKNPVIPVVTSVRDPLLAIITLVWREYGKIDKFVTEHPYMRLGRVVAHVKRIENLLFLPAGRVFLFPIDAKNIDKSLLCKNLFDHCGLVQTEDTERYIQDWKPQNETKNWDLFKSDYEIDKFEEIKRDILNGKDDLVKEYFKIEFDYLKTCDNLKISLKNLGYENLVWF
jgi:hypothetical protein